MNRFTLLLVLLSTPLAWANPPVVNYIYPAGGQRGTVVPVRVGGLFLHDECDFEITGKGVKGSPQLKRTPRIWFEGPILPLPDSQQQEDYPSDMAGEITIAKDAPIGAKRVRVFTSQGGATGPLFVLGDLPEVLENEVEGEAIPQKLALPVTANGRIFPREDIDLWEIACEAGKPVTVLVHSQSLRSPLNPKIDLLDSQGKVVAQPMLYPCVGSDASLKFTPKIAGKYTVRIRDARSQGGQAYVYRLTVTGENVPEYHFPIKAKPDGLKDIIENKGVYSTPIAVSGRINKSELVDAWRILLVKGQVYTFDLQAKVYESPLVGVVTILDSTGKELRKIEATDALDPTPTTFTPPADGEYRVQVREKYRNRFGENFVYRLRVTPEEKGIPGYRLLVEGDVHTLLRDGTAKVNVQVERFGGFNDPIDLEVVVPGAEVPSLPKQIAPNQNQVQLTLSAKSNAKIQHIPMRIRGTSKGKNDVPPVFATVKPDKTGIEQGELTLCVAIPTPFKILDQYVMTSAPRGEVYRRKYMLERGDFTGPVTVQLADKQARHLQGVTGPVLTIKADQKEFEYPAFLPSWMELGRTCRVCIMATGKVKDPLDGREHTVCFSSTGQNQQMIVVVEAGRLDIECEKESIRAEGVVKIPVKIARSQGLKGDVQLEAVIPSHWRGVSAKPVVIPANQNTGELVLSFEKESGPFNLPLTIRGTLHTKETPITAELKIDVVK